MHQQQQRRNRFLWFVIACLAALAGLTALLPPAFVTANAQQQPGSIQLEVELFASGFNRLVKLANAGDERLFVVEAAGLVYIFHPDGARNEEPFLDITDRVTSGGERGLLGLAFEPEDKSVFYVNYTRRSDTPADHGDTVIARYRTVTGNPDQANAESEEIILVIDQPFSNHNAGDLAFGNDGYLYIPMGDGGSGGDPLNLAQNLNELLGKMLRLDVVGQITYTIPPGNPYADDGDPNTRAEIWSSGLRNPWRFSVDRETGEFYIADVGQDAWEEINVEPPNTPGRNYGWRRCEGSYLFPVETPPQKCADPELTDPVFEYGRDDGVSVTGGFVYRGAQYPKMAGHYIFADWGSSIFWSMIRNDEGEWVVTRHGALGMSNPSTFGENGAGELFVARLGQPGRADAAIYRIKEVSGPPPPTAPALTPWSYLPLVGNSD